MNQAANLPELLTTSEVAALFRVSAKTIGEWRKKGIIPAVVTPAGWPRYRRDTVERLAAERNAHGSQD